MRAGRVRRGAGGAAWAGGRECGRRRGGIETSEKVRAKAVPGPHRAGAPRPRRGTTATLGWGRTELGATAAHTAHQAAMATRRGRTAPGQGSARQPGGRASCENGEEGGRGRGRRGRRETGRLTAGNEGGVDGRRARATELGDRRNSDLRERTAATAVRRRGPGDTARMGGRECGRRCGGLRRARRCGLRRRWTI
jgi:hypothetical protein